VFYRGIKTNIFINIAVLLVLAMILINFVIIIAVQNITPTCCISDIPFNQI